MDTRSSKDKIMSENSEEKAALRVYELAYLLSPNVGEDKLGETVSRIKSVLEKRGAFLISDEFPRFRQLAYTMIKPLGGRNEKFTSAYFGWIKFEIVPAAEADLKADFKQEGAIVRFLIVKTEREAQPPPRAFVRRETVKREAAKTEGKGTMTEAEIDKTIEELLVE